jgi:hypothetical protein
MTYRVITASLIAAFLLSGTAPFAHAQTPAVQKAFEEVKTKLDDLVSAKDENLADNLALRIQAFKKVAEFSVEEAKTLKVKLIATELKEMEKETLAAWKTRMGEELAGAETYYEEVLTTLTTSTAAFDLAELKTLATSFKEWRENSFAPLASEVEGFLLVAGQYRALEVAGARLMKIEGDVKKLERAKIKGAETLTTLLAKAKVHFNDAAAAYARAETLFTARIVPPVLPEDTEADATSTEPIATSTEPSATSLLAGEASTDALPEAEVATPPSIHDEVRASLEAVKEAYRTFIAMSVEVKKILK